MKILSVLGQPPTLLELANLNLPPHWLGCKTSVRFPVDSQSLNRNSRITSSGFFVCFWFFFLHSGFTSSCVTLPWGLCSQRRLGKRNRQSTPASLYFMYSMYWPGTCWTSAPPLSDTHGGLCRLWTTDILPHWGNDQRTSTHRAPEDQWPSKNSGKTCEDT
jgi:hypothetical protein